jgi:hypothetical protein
VLSNAILLYSAEGAAMLLPAHQFGVYGAFQAGILAP